MYVYWDGRVGMCCFDHEADQILGDANNNHLQTIWNESQWIRDKHNDLKFDIKPCDMCNVNTLRK